MSELHSAEQVAARLGLHVKTVRNYVRGANSRPSGSASSTASQARTSPRYRRKLPGLAREDVRRTRHVEVSSAVAVDAISRQDADRVMAMVMAALNGRREDDEPMRVQTVYDEERGGCASCCSAARRPAPSCCAW